MKKNLIIIYSLIFFLALITIYIGISVFNHVGILYAAIIVAVLVAIIANLLYLSKKFN